MFCDLARLFFASSAFKDFDRKGRKGCAKSAKKTEAEA